MASAGLKMSLTAFTLTWTVILATVSAPTCVWWLLTSLLHSNWSQCSWTVALCGLTLERTEHCQSVTGPLCLSGWCSCSLGFLSALGNLWEFCSMKYFISHCNTGWLLCRGRVLKGEFLSAVVGWIGVGLNVGHILHSSALSIRKGHILRGALSARMLAYNAVPFDISSIVDCCWVDFLQNSGGGKSHKCSNINWDNLVYI